MSRDPEAVAKITENTYKNVMDQFNPGLRNLVNLGKNYEKAVSAMVQAGRAYFDGVTKVGDLAKASPVSRELGQVLLEISSVHKKLNDSLEENFRKFHREIIAELERKTEQDVKYMNATLKRYQTEHKQRVDSLEKSQAELKKLRRKSQGAKNATKYDVKESEYLETINSRQNDIEKFIAEGCREALLEEKRRFCFLVDKHCSFSNYLNYFHIQSSDLLTSKIPKWQETCTDVSQVPDTVLNNMKERKTPLSTPISGTPEPSPLIEKKPLITGEYEAINRNSLRMPPAPPTSRAHTSPLVDMFNNPAVAPKMTYDRLKPSQAEGTDDGILPRSMSVATGLNLMKKPKVRTIFPHTGNSKTLLSFQQGDVITLLLPEEKDGWLYGEHDTTKLKGWFPSSYTRPIEENGKEFTQVPSATPSPAPVRSLSTANLLDKSNMVLPEPDYLEQSSYRDSPEPEQVYTTSFAKEPALAGSNGSPKTTPNGVMKHPFLSGENPFATVKLRPTVTNDRSAPVIR